MINSVYGKTIENLQKREKVRLVNNKKNFFKYNSRLTPITHKIFGNNYAAIHEIKPVLMLNKSIYLEFTVLELSKSLVYDFHYKFIKKHFDAELLYSDTDSLTYEIKSEDIYEEFFKHKHLLDFSNFLKDSKFFGKANKKVIGKMKYVSEGKIINEFVGLKSKVYSMKIFDVKESNTTKGMNITAAFNKFKDTLFNKKILRYKMRRIQAKKHKLGTCEINKISLSCFDDKRFVLNDGFHTLAYFHKDIDSHTKKSSQEKEEILTDKKDFHKKKKFSQIKRIPKDFHKKKRFSRTKRIQKDFHKKKRFSRIKRIQKDFS